MKLTKKLEAEILKAYNDIWNAYLKGDMRTFASILDENCYIIGSSAGEVFDNKKAAVKYYKTTAGQITGKAEMRNRKIDVMPADKGFIVNEESDFYLLIDDHWTFYGSARISSLFHKKNNKWKVVHQHGSFPDSKTEGGEQVNSEKIKAENIQLRDAVKRRTIELEEKNRELEIEAAVERVRAKALAMHKSEEISNVVNTLRNELDGLKIPGVAAATITLQQENGNIRLWDITSVVELEDGFHFNMDIIFSLKNTKPNDWIRKIWDGSEKYFVYKQDKKSFKRTLAWTSKYNPEFADNARRFLETNKIKNAWHPVVQLSHGKLSLDLLQEPVAEIESILTKMGAAFDLAYKRFLDLQKSEAQAKEARIETALERIRARALAMHSSDELMEVAKVLREQLALLGQPDLETSVVHLYEEDPGHILSWRAFRSGTGSEITYGYIAIPKNSCEFVQEWLTNYYSNSIEYTIEISGAKQKEWYDVLFKYAPDVINAMRQNKTIHEKRYHQFSKFSGGALLMVSKQRPSEESVYLQRRAALVFDLAYRRFLDLKKAEAQARESKIEASLERVRARTMAMQKSDELPETSYLLFQQLKELGETAAQLSIGIIKEKEGFVELSATIHGSQLLQTYDVSMDEPFVMKKALKAWKEKERLLVIKLKGKELKDYNNWRNNFLGKKIVFPEEQWIINIIYFSKGFLSFSSDKQIPEETIQLLERFAGVFDQTYTRFLDLQKAEAQARESQIQLALERVRARTMAMQHSDELKDAAALLFQQVKALGVPAYSCGYNIWEKNEKVFTSWMSTQDGSDFNAVLNIPLTEDANFIRFAESKEKGEQFFVLELRGERMQEHYQYLRNIPAFREWFDYAIKMGFDLPETQIHHLANFSDGNLLFITLEPCPEFHDVFKRFAAVFEQTYTRFLDLQKAEAQARESQIELGLERVRARAMAMQKSDELSELVDTVFKELTKLDFALTWCIINIIDESTMSNTVWAANPDINKAPESYHMLFEDYPFHHAMMKGWKERNTKCLYVLEGLEKKVYDEYLFNETEFKRVPAAAQAASKAMEKYVVTFSFSNFGGLQTVGDVPLSDANVDILSRFGKVFDLTYTRFNDLKQAEAQARESQIQLAMERVRARTMAMQHSDELAEAASLLFTQIAELGTNSWSSGFIIFQPDELSINSWMSKPDGSMGVPFNIPVTEDPFFIKIYEAYKRGEEFFVMESSGKELVETYKYMFSLPGAAKALGAIEDLGFQMPTFQITHCVFFPTGFLMFITYKPCQEMWEIFKRFGKVFEQTYTRFLDLQKAEAQAKESQIQLALERVRARTMAMQRSDELMETAVVLFDQLKQLGENIERTIIGVMNEEERVVDIWATRPDGSQMIRMQKFPIDEPIVMQKVYAAWRQQKKSIVIDLRGEGLESYFQFLKSRSSQLKRESFGERRVENFAFFSKGMLGVINADPDKAANVELYERFAAVFEQTYTRFLDLQKAEAQTREAQIELALERVRARTMAMQKSDELSETSSVLFHELKNLGIETIRSGVGIFNGEDDTAELWLTTESDKKIETRVIGSVHASAHPAFQNWFTKWKQKESSFSFELTGDAVRNYYETLSTYLSLPPQQVYHSKECLNGFFFPEGSLNVITQEPLSEESSKIMFRFARVFGLLYRRFLDLQKAERQAREAQIELALERVRSKTMAMHHSDELTEVLSLLFEQFDVLAINPNHAILSLVDFEKNTVDFRLTGKAGKRVSAHQVVDLNTMDIWKEIVERWKKDGPDTINCIHYPKELLPQVWEIFSEVINAIPEEARIKIEDFPDGMYNTEAYCRFGYIGFCHTRFATDEEKNILVRFATEFGRLYQRFLDLQKAEAQAREAQIEAALERVRSRTMAMYNSEDVTSATDTMFEELKKLGIDNLRCGIANIHHNRTFDVFGITNLAGGNKMSGYGIFGMDELPIWQRWFESWINKEEVFIAYIAGQEKEEYFNNINNHLNYLPQQIVNFPDSFFQAYYFEHGSVWAYSLLPHSEAEKDIMKRFATVFSLTYRRYQDLKQAEAQAREAKIEAGLERVRSRAMAMQTSEELNELIGTVFTELTKLDLVLTRSVILIYEGNEKGVRWWMANSEAPSTPMNFFVKYADLPFFNAYLKGWHDRSLKWQYILEGEDKIATDKVLFNETELSQLPDFVIAGMKANDKVYLSASFNNYGCLNLASVEPLSDEQFEILLRFAKVFDLTYTRFNDLKQAEAQARESQIQLALERVRARTMAMQKSDELPETSFLLFQQVKELGETTVQNSIAIVNEEAGLVELSTTVQGHHLPHTLKVPINDPYVMAKAVAAWKAKHKSLKLEFEGQELKDYNEHRNSFFDTKINFPEDQWIVNIIFFSQGWLSFSSDKNISDETFDLLKRFTAVFEQTYIRFNDLKQAEAQAREASVEAALEKVRSRSLAMHKSDELQEVVNTVFEKLRDLNIEMDSANIAILKEGSRDLDYWIASPFQKRVASFHMPYLDLSITRDITAARESGTDYSATAYSFEEKNEWFDYAFKNTDFKFLTVERKQFIMNAPGIMVAIAFSKHTGVQVNRYSNKLLTEGEAEILKRFSKVFEQAYIRFLDLQKAEAQANEARIEIALERIRARALAMHKSDELMEVAKVMREQMALLGQAELEASAVHLYEEDSDHILSWRAVTIGSDAKRELTFGHMAIPKNSCEFVREWLTKFYSDVKEYTIELSGSQQQEWYDVLFTLAPEVVNSMRQKNSIHEKRYYRFSKFSGGALLMISKQEPSEEAAYLQSRAAVVFDLAYRRFSDLQKAEAQARDAQIESSLERVRSKTMAMHNSQDVGDTVATMFDELVKLGIQTLRCGVGIMQENYHMELWTAKPNETGKIELFVGHLDMKLHPLLTGGYESWIDKRDSFSYELKGDDLITYFNAINNYSDYHANYDIASLPSRIFHDVFNFNEGCLFSFSLKQLSAEASQIFKRFAGVFGQTYRRYLDLLKAEAQAREAKIEASLERVRAKAMAMHKSDDLHGAVTIMFEEFHKLNLDVLRCGIGILNKDSKTGTVWTTSVSDNGLAVQISANENFDIHPLMMLIYEYWQKQEDLDYVLQGQDLIDYYNAMDASELKLPKSQLVFSDDELQPQYYYAAMFSAGGLYSFRNKPFDAEDKKIMKRFASVVNLTYNRFLDLQKAEAQAREAKIEASLERVRAKAMAMHKSEDLNSAVATVFEELDKLDLGVLRCGISILDKEKRTGDIWVTSITDQGSAVQVSGDESFDIHPLLQGAFEAWLKKEEFSYLLKGDDLTQYYKAVQAENFQLPDSQILSSEAEFKQQYCFATPYGAGGLFAFRETEFPVEAKAVMKRFAGVFDLTYKRFLDLQRAEASAREAKIEAALERVRAKAMAMHSSQDLAETLNVFYRELKSLSAVPIRCGVALMDKETRLAELTTMNTTEKGDSIEIAGTIKMTGHPVLDGVYENWLVQKEYHAVLRGNQIKEYYQVLKPQISYLDYSHDEVQFGYYFMFKEGDVYAWTEQELTEDELTIYRRFTTVISLTYKRYKDLQQAEAQAREAKIEAGLERVRARTMAMHSSDDVSIATATMFTELEKLGIENFRGGITNIITNRTQDVWSVNHLAEGKVLKAVGTFNIDAHPFWQLMFNEWLAKKDFIHYFLAGKEKEEYVKVLNSNQAYLPQALQEFPDVHFQVYYFNEGAVWTNSLQPHSEEDQQVMKKFASVFSLTFRRYQDLKKAEAQAREATIEAALEKVRGKAMAMHNSNDLSATASLVFTELRKLGINPVRCGVSLQTKETRKNLLYYSIPSAEGDNLSLAGTALLEGHPVLSEVYDSWMRGEDYFPVLKGESLMSYYQILKQVGFDVPVSPPGHEQYGYYLAFSEGMFYGWAEKPFTESEIKILKRFASVIDLTFRRYMELQKSEANAREAVKQAALDRVRAEIASMRTVSDLERITPLIWNELTTLNIPFIRCGVFIMDEEQQLIHTFLSTPDGKAIAAFHLPYDTPGNFRDMLNHWYNKKTYVNHWDEKDFVGIAETLVKQGAVASKEQYLGSLPKGGFYLHFLPFLQGMLYVGNTEQLDSEQIELIQHVADAFSTAYARYEDFTRLEAAKQQVEQTLTDLKQAQTQLVQSEKMASLGELTAGIAHEIQNPLNFVNNFSDVSNELLEEMKQELATGNTQQAIDIANDVRDNLEKILHHGKRADAIVKGMLQHSRTSSGQKEPTDINVLADEYLRLAFHGLRAKDKSFNAKFETEFDNSIGKINVIPQDIGRVILNLINNAFYAVTEKKKHASTGSAPNGYDPVVTVTTRKENGKVEIKVRDNGNGISQKVLDKIFQPFFTTKPTGQGTGLGLSLSYDIIKAHGGELKVETKEGEGAVFIIQMPIN